MVDVVTLPDIEPINYEILMRALYLLSKNGNRYEKDGANFLLKYFDAGVKVE